MEPLHGWLNGLPVDEAVLIVSALVALLTTIITLALVGIIICIVLLVETRRAKWPAGLAETPHLGDLPHMPQWPQRARGDRP